MLRACPDCGHSLRALDCPRCGFDQLEEDLLDEELEEIVWFHAAAIRSVPCSSRGRPVSGGRLCVAVDVQHLFRQWPYQRDRGAAFRFSVGIVPEADLSTMYAREIVSLLSSSGVTVVTNCPPPISGFPANVPLEHGARFVGTYTQRGRYAAERGCQLFLACHVNAGGGRYALVGAMAGSSIANVRARLVAGMIAGELRTLPGIHGAQVKALHRWDPPRVGPDANQPLRFERGAICIAGAAARGVPAVLLEPFFGDNPEHQARLTSADGLRLVAGRVVDPVLEWALSLP